MITYTQVQHEEKDLFNDAQIRVIGSIELEICTKMLRELMSEKLRERSPLTTSTLGYSTVRISRLNVLLFLSSLEIIKLTTDQKMLKMYKNQFSSGVDGLPYLYIAFLQRMIYYHLSHCNGLAAK